MGSVAKVLNPVSAVKAVYKSIKGSGSSARGQAVTGPRIDYDSQQHHEKTLESNKADVSKMPDGIQASRPQTGLTGLGGVSKEDLKLSKRKALGG